MTRWTQLCYRKVREEARWDLPGPARTVRLITLYSIQQRAHNPNDQYSCTRQSRMLVHQEVPGVGNSRGRAEGPNSGDVFLQHV